MTDNSAGIKKLKFKISAAAVTIPFLLFTLNQLMLQIFNLEYPDLVVRLRFAVQPTIYLLYGSAAAVIIIVIDRQLNSLYRFLNNKQKNDKARKSSLKIPWILIMVNTGLWLFAITLFYFLQGFNTKGGVPYFWSLATNSISGCISATLSALVINRILIPAKISLNMTEIKKGERDLFVRIKIPLIFITGFIYAGLVLVYAARFYTFTAAENLPQLPISFTAAMLVTAIIGLVPAMLNMIFALSEDRIQRRFLLKKMNLLTNGSGGLGAKVTLINFDETGALAAVINSFIDKIRTLIIKADGAGNQIVDTSKDIESLLEVLSDSTGTMLEAINSVDNEMGEQEGEISRATSELQNFFNMLDELNDNINSQSSSVEQTSKSAEFIAQTIRESSSIVSSVEEKTNALENVTSDGSGHIAEFIESIRAVEQSSTKVEEILEQMNLLSDQIDMLAMNAAIEAAHAGETGRGFAVVAEEVRRLSENNAEQSGQISAQMTEMRSSISEGNKKTQLADTAFSEISKSMENAAEQFKLITRNAREEESAIEEMLMTVRQLVGITESLKHIASAQRKQNEKIKTAIETVFKRFGGIRNSMNAHRENRYIVSNSLLKLKSITDANLNKAQGLNEILKQFKLDENR
ncbi:MAG: methyl-accepting chemotaxis protein [Spirochaetales bacterium]|uniref:Methyl-accepting chemotaxis protein n=1 Tax=Candidatus Thalassospirochaeta sargassi TaxID=3119039 RepID=A0AAJ1IFW4_9SPIO|nr:methyl-accepting chemotaxis protein [Spirochaetales bacterium]